MESYKEHSLVLRFSDEGVNEPRLIRSVFAKLEKITDRAGFKRDFDPLEIDLIKSTISAINKQYERMEEK